SQSSIFELPATGGQVAMLQFDRILRFIDECAVPKFAIEEFVAVKNQSLVLEHGPSVYCHERLLNSGERIISLSGIPEAHQTPVHAKRVPCWLKCSSRSGDDDVSPPCRVRDNSGRIPLAHRFQGC